MFEKIIYPICFTVFKIKFEEFVQIVIIKFLKCCFAEVNGFSDKQ